MRGVLHAGHGRPGGETTNKRGLGVSTGLQPRPSRRPPHPTGIFQEQISPTGIFCSFRHFRANFRPFSRRSFHSSGLRRFSFWEPSLLGFFSEKYVPCGWGVGVAHKTKRQKIRKTENKKDFSNAPPFRKKRPLSYTINYPIITMRSEKILQIREP